ncbi:ATP-dependent RNA helicase, partial [Haematococcus lacustris]
MAGFYPSVLRVEHPPATYIKVEGGAVRVESEPSSLKFFDKQRGRAFIHPGSVNFKVGDFASGWAVYTQMTATTKLFVRESSMAPMYSVALFGGELRVNSERSRIMVDDVAEFQAPALVGVLLRRLRMVLDSVLAEKIQNPGLDFSADRAVGVIMQLLATDGF